VHIRNLHYRYPGTSEDILRIPSLEVSGSGLIALTGPSGAGKTTLVELLAGTLREDYGGSVEVLGREWKSLARDAERQRQLRRIGLIPQDFGLLGSWTPRETIERDLADAEVPKEQHAARLSSSLAQVGLSEFADRRIASLSGGQRQRAAIARMLARDVELVIADEPTANLDPERVSEIVGLLRKLARKAPVIVVTHDPRVAECCDRTIVLQAAVTAETDAQVRDAGVRRPMARWVWVAIGVAVVAAAILGAYVLARHKSPTPSASVSKTSSPAPIVTSTPTVAASPSPSYARVAFLRQLEALMTRSSAYRESIIQAVDGTRNFAMQPSDAMAEVQTVMTGRQALLGEAQSMTAPDSESARALGFFESSLSYSLAADRCFSRWMSTAAMAQAAGATSAPNNSYYQKAKAIDTQADQAKASLASLVDQLAAPCGLRCDWRSGDL
jgi:ABC-type lipoprotein export system ATPase subunit